MIKMAKLFNSLRAICSIGALSIAAAVISAPVQAQEQALPLEDVTLTVGLSIAPPFVIVEGDFTELSGIDVDIVKEMQKRTGFKLANGRIDVMNFNELINQAENNKIDIVGGGLTLTSERSRKFAVVGPTYVSTPVVVVKKNSSIECLADLEGKSVAAEQGTTEDDFLPEGTAESVTMKHTITNFLTFYNVSRGLADSLVIDEPIALDYIEHWEGSDLKIAFPVGDEKNPLGLLMKKNTNASNILARVFRDMQQDGTIDRIVDKYLGDTLDQITYRTIEKKQHKSYTQEANIFADAQNQGNKMLEPEL